jgi:hypothetical protein
MAVTRFEIRSRTPLEDGRPFGATGAYERIDGVLHLAVDPLHAANRAVVDLDRAARDASGLVHFEADVSLLQPVDPSKANGRLLGDVVNRGGRTWVNYNLTARDAARPDWIPVGDGFLMERGWTIASIGWQWDVIRGGGLIGLEAPMALDGGAPIEGDIVVTHQLVAPATQLPLADRAHLPYPAADVAQPDARLLVRDYPSAPAREIERARWRFARLEDGREIPAATHVVLDGGFEAGPIYEVIYRTSVSPIVGAGLLSFRDGASFFRYATGDDNPARGRISHAFAIGVSQSGRFLRTLLEAGLNTDEAGRPAYDGLHIHIAGARRGEFNHRYAQPSVQYSYGFGHRPPFGYEDATDPRTEEPIPGALSRQRAAGGAPKVIATNSSAEYWRGDAGLLHIDMAGTRDLPDAPEARAYHFAGTQHGSGAPPLKDVTPTDASARGAHFTNITHYGPLFRAALVNLERWVCEGVEPPASAVPRVADGTAVTRERVIEAFRAFPTATTPRAERLWRVPRLDLGPEAESGVGRYPVVEGQAYPALVGAVDADGNEISGIRLPDVSVPIATLTGWNPRHPDTGGEGQIMPMTGSTIPFAVSASERARTGDPRPAIEERYRDRADYLARVRAAAEELVAQRYLLPEDVEVVVSNASVRWDALVPTPVG